MEQEKKMVLPHLGIVVTTYCNLECRRCADLIPKRGGRHYSLEELKADMLRLLAVISYINEVLIIGGEIFLYPWLEEVLDFCRKQEKIGKLIITTNGSITPAPRVLDCVKKNGVVVRVSGYPENVAPERDVIIKKFEAAGIEVENFENMTWGDVGSEQKRGRTIKELEEVFRTCTMRDCVSMQSEGKIFYCSRAMSAYEMDVYPDPLQAEYIDVRGEENLEVRLQEFYSLRYISTCDYCDGLSCATKQLVPAAVQILNKNVFLELLEVVCVWEEKRQLDMETVSRLKDLLLVNKDFLLDLPEYVRCLDALGNVFSENPAKYIESFMEELRRLVNILTDDYSYCVDERILCAKAGDEKRKVSNLITIGDINGLGAEDLLVSAAELEEQLNKRYPLDAIEYNRLFVESRLEKLEREQTECIVCGLSYTQYGFLEKKMPVNTLNLSVIGQDIPYSVSMAKKALELNDGIKTIIIPMTYYHGFYDISTDEAPLHQAVMSRINIPLLGKKYNNIDECKIGEDYRRDSLRIYDKICDFDMLRKQRAKEWRALLGERDYFNEFFPEPVHGGLKFDFKDLEEKERWIGAKKTAELNERIVTEDGYRKVIDSLESFLPEMEKRGIQLIFFVPPMTKYLYAAYSDNLKNEFIKRLWSVLERYENVKAMDLSCEESFDVDDFSDYEHLNKKGAVKLTAILSGAVQKERKID